MPEADYQLLYELDVQRKKLLARVEAEGTERDGVPDQRASGGRRLLRREVGPEEIAEVVSAWTGVPVTRMLETEKAKLLVLEERLHQRLVGQDEAVEAVANAVRRSRSGLQDPHRPIGSFIFLGPTGVGKTELCKALAEVLFDDSNAMVRIDMSEFMERHSVSRLIGAPPGYVGYEEGGRLTEAVRRRPYSVVLLDEIEKAHRDVFNILLQVLDDGRLSDSLGHTVDFTNTIVVMTSNIGSQLIQQISQEGGSEEDMREGVKATLQERFLPEFLNRIDETIIFHSLDRKQVRKIAGLQIERLRQQLEQNGLTLDVTAAALDEIAVQGYDPLYGARPLKRVIQQRIQNPLATEILRGEFAEGSVVRIDFRDGEFTFERGPAGRVGLRRLAFTPLGCGKRAASQRSRASATRRRIAWHALLAVAYLQAPVRDDDLGAGRHASQFGGDDCLFRNGGLFQPRSHFLQLFAAMSAAFDFLSAVADATHVQLLATSDRGTSSANRSFGETAFLSAKQAGVNVGKTGSGLGSRAKPASYNGPIFAFFLKWGLRSDVSKNGRFIPSHSAGLFMRGRMVGMKSTAFTRALIAGLVAVSFCIAGDLIPFRPDAMSERAWGMAWAMAGMTLGIAASRRLAKDRG